VDLDKLDAENLDSILRTLDGEMDGELSPSNIPQETREDLMKLKRERLGEVLLYLMDKAFYQQQAKAKWHEVYQDEELELRVIITRIS
jgi:hypothetical protein